MDTDALLGQALAGDAEALAELLLGYRRYLSLLARIYVRRQLQAKVDPSDLAQDACVEALSSFVGFRGSTVPEFTAWLKQVLASKGLQAIRHYQTRARDVGRERPLDPDWEASSAALDRLAEATITPSDTPSRHVMHVESAMRLAEALEKLSPVEQEVIIQHGLESVAMSEVAVRLQRSVDNVWKVWARGLVKLRRQLGAAGL